MLKLHIFFYTQFVITPTRFGLSWSYSGNYWTSIQLIWKHRWISKYVKISANAIKLVCSNVELVHKMLTYFISPLFVDGFLYWSVAMFLVWRHEHSFQGFTAVCDRVSVSTYPRMIAACMLFFIASLLQQLPSSQCEHVWDVNTRYFCWMTLNRSD